MEIILSLTACSLQLPNILLPCRQIVCMDKILLYISSCTRPGKTTSEVAYYGRRAVEKVCKDEV